MNAFILSLLLVPGPTDAVSPADVWPQWRGPTADSVSTEKGILAPWPKEGLRIVWRRQVGEGYPMPAISKGRLFLFNTSRQPQHSYRRRRRAAKCGPLQPVVVE